MWEKYRHVVAHISVGSGVIGTVADWVSGQGYRVVLVVCDPNTRRIAGEHVLATLIDAGLIVYECCFTAEEPLPNEESIGILTAAYTPDIELIIGVGSGTINDICTYVGSKVGRPSAIVGTAPSMDGFASLGSAMLLDGVKVTPPTQCPIAIFCDVDILTAAPMHLIAAGLGDMLGKLTALADWRLANILVGESMPEDIVSIVKTALDKIIAGAPHITERDPAVIQSVTEGLILSGIAMSLHGDSRPASGTEHHLAHFWEMRMIAEGRKPALHGTKVGLATVTALAMWHEIGDGSLSCKTRFCADYESNIRRLYGRTADTVLQTNNPNLPIEHIKDHWDEILEIARSLPSPEDVAGMLSSAGAPVTPSGIGLDSATLHDSIIYARDRKKTYTLLQLLGDLGKLENYANFVNSYFPGKALSGVKCFVLDMDGTIYLGNKIFPYTLGFLKHLQKTGKDFIFFTNNSSRNTAHYIKKLKNMGISITPEKLLMSTQVLISHLQQVNGSSAFVAGTDALKTDFINAGYTLTEENPNFVVLGFDTDMDYSRLTKLCDFVRTGIPYYGVHTDYNCPVEGGFIPDCGSLAAAVTASTGITPEFFGKPSRRVLDFIIDKTGYREDELCFVGDRLYTDIAITKDTKACSVLVLSGETKREHLPGSKFIPDLIVEDLSELMQYD